MPNSMGKFRNTYFLIEKNLPHTYISLGTVYTVLNQNVAIMMNLKKKETLDFERKTYSTPSTKYSYHRFFYPKGRQS